MLEDGNPAELFEAKGEGLWKQKRGPRNATLEALRPGQGPGRGQGRLRRSCRATLPTPTACMDLETRLVHCMETLQGFDAAEIARTAVRQRRAEQRHRAGHLGGGRCRAACASTCSQAHPQERRSYEIGKRVFFYRGGSHDFSCAACHSARRPAHPAAGPAQPHAQPGRRRGLRGLAAYRVSNGQMWGMQLRLNDCYRQQRFPYPGFGIGRRPIAPGHLHGRRTPTARQSIAPADQALRQRPAP
jgi:sulfur-oxidizing protein SoxA